MKKKLDSLGENYKSRLIDSLFRKSNTIEGVLDFKILNIYQPRHSSSNYPLFSSSRPPFSSTLVEKIMPLCISVE